MNILLLPAYMPPIPYFAYILHSETTTIEIHDHYVKQTYRNRCEILAANGLINLTVPIKKNVRGNCPMRLVQLDYSTDWNRIHWNTICSAYGSSPFFEYYMDDFAIFYKNRWTFLHEFNEAIIRCFISLLDIQCTILHTTYYQEQLEEPLIDLRNKFSPKKKDQMIQDSNYRAPIYRQLFSDKHHFIANLSMLDLLFNKGPESYEILRNSLTLNN